MIRRSVPLLVAVTLAATVVACGSDSSRPADSAGAPAAPTTLTLVAYDSFPTADTPLNAALAEFGAANNATVRVVTAGDTGTMVSKAVLTAGNPEGDVLWGVDNTYLSAATKGGIFATAPTKVDIGDVCVNYDIAWFEQRGIDPPTALDDLLQPQYRDLLVVQNPATSSPGLAFLLATVAKYGDDPATGWQAYWTALRANGVEVTDGWEAAYYERFSGSGGGDKPLVVSYGSSPPAEVVFADPPRTDAPTGVAAETCFRQEEYAGVLRGTDHPELATALVTFLASPRFQQELPLTLFVYPVDPAVPLPEVFTDFAVRPTDPLSVSPDLIDANREQWLDQWTQIVLR